MHSDVTKKDCFFCEYPFLDVASKLKYPHTFLPPERFLWASLSAIFEANGTLGKLEMSGRQQTPLPSLSYEKSMLFEEYAAATSTSLSPHRLRRPECEFNFCQTHESTSLQLKPSDFLGIFSDAALFFGLTPFRAILLPLEKRRRRDLPPGCKGCVCSFKSWLVPHPLNSFHNQGDHAKTLILGKSSFFRS